MLVEPDQAKQVIPACPSEQACYPRGDIPSARAYGCLSQQERLVR